MVLEVALGDRGEPAIVVVTVEPFFRRAVADPVLHDGDHAARVHATRAVLEPLDIGTHQPTRERRILAKGAGDARPARLRCEIRLRRERHLDADCAILLPRDVAEPAHERRIADRGESERFGPLRELARPDGRAENVLEVISRIGADRDRDAEPRALGDLLERVALCREQRRGSAEAGDHAVDLRALDQPAVRGGVVRGTGAGHTHRTRGARGSVHHRTRLLLERHAGGEIACTCSGCESPVLVWLELAVPIQVAEA